jgi:hypothetical protein
MPVLHQLVFSKGLDLASGDPRLDPLQAVWAVLSDVDTKCHSVKASLALFCKFFTFVGLAIEAAEN